MRTMKDRPQRYGRQWVSNLLGFDFTIEFRPGSTNTIADVLSQCDTETSSEVMAISPPSFRLFDNLHDEHMEDTTFWSAVEAGDHGTAWRIIDGIITLRGRPFITATSPLHEGIEKTLHRH
jgi:hypothetical protein